MWTLRTATTFAVLLLFLQLPDVTGDTCTQRSLFGHTTYTYCAFACCGSYNEYCCYSGSFIVGVTFAAIGGLVGIVFLVIFMVKCWCLRPRAINAPPLTVHYTGGHVHMISSSSVTPGPSSSSYPGPSAFSPVQKPPPYKSAEDPPPPYPY